MRVLKHYLNSSGAKSLLRFKPKPAHLRRSGFFLRLTMFNVMTVHRWQSMERQHTEPKICSVAIGTTHEAQSRQSRCQKLHHAHTRRCDEPVKRG